MNSTDLLDYFWKQVTKRVVPVIQSNGKRTVGVWMADRCVSSIATYYLLVYNVRPPGTY
jgi:hypothetical protein